MSYNVLPFLFTLLLPLHFSFLVSFIYVSLSLLFSFLGYPVLYSASFVISSLTLFSLLLSSIPSLFFLLSLPPILSLPLPLPLPFPSTPFSLLSFPLIYSSPFSIHFSPPPFLFLLHLSFPFFSPYVSPLPLPLPLLQGGALLSDLGGGSGHQYGLDQLGQPEPRLPAQRWGLQSLPGLLYLGLRPSHCHAGIPLPCGQLK